MSKTNIRPMIEVALFATIAYILDLVTQPMSLGPWIYLSFSSVFAGGLKLVLWAVLSGGYFKW